jgi:hypothetical protein
MFNIVSGGTAGIAVTNGGELGVSGCNRQAVRQHCFLGNNWKVCLEMCSLL